MILTPEETHWVTDRMEIYDVKYQEIYNELFDHILTAIEVKRTEGDIRDIKVVFQDVVDNHFGGYTGIEQVAAGQEKAYVSKIAKIFKASIRSYLNWKLLAFTIVAVGLTFIVPNAKLMHNILLILIYIFAFSPVIYTYMYINKNAKSIEGKKSLLKGQIVSRALLPAFLLNGVLYLPTLFYLTDENGDGFKLYRQLPLPVLMLIMILFMVLNLAAISMCNQAVKKEAVQ